MTPPPLRFPKSSNLGDLIVPKDSDEDEDDELEEEEATANESEKEKKEGSMKDDKNGEKEKRRGSEMEKTTKLKEKFMKIGGTSRYICQVQDCRKVLHRSSKMEHLRSRHKLLPALICNKCSFSSFSKSVLNRHKKKH